MYRFFYSFLAIRIDIYFRCSGYENILSNIVYYANRAQKLIVWNQTENSHFSIPRFRCYAQRNTLTFYKGEFCEQFLIIYICSPFSGNFYIWFHIKYGKDVFLWMYTVATPKNGVSTIRLYGVLVKSVHFRFLLLTYSNVRLWWTKFSSTSSEKRKGMLCKVWNGCVCVFLEKGNFILDWTLHLYVNGHVFLKNICQDFFYNFYGKFFCLFEVKWIFVFLWWSIWISHFIQKIIIRAYCYNSEIYCRWKRKKGNKVMSKCKFLFNDF